MQLKGVVDCTTVPTHPSSSNLLVVVSVCSPKESPTLNTSLIFLSNYSAHDHVMIKDIRCSLQSVSADPCVNYVVERFSSTSNVISRSQLIRTISVLPRADKERCELVEPCST